VDCRPPGRLQDSPAGVDIFAFAGTAEVCDCIDAALVRWTSFVARQRSHARDQNINRVDNEMMSVGDDAWNSDSLAPMFYSQ